LDSYFVLIRQFNSRNGQKFCPKRSGFPPEKAKKLAVSPSILDRRPKHERGWHGKGPVRPLQVIAALSAQ
jgi:hypothetical protein